jgi:hypothetical protein
MKLVNVFKNHYLLLVFLILSFWSVRMFFQEGFYVMHDDTQVARVFEMGKMLKEGVFPVRWVPDLGYGYGYPIYNFYAPLSYYFGGLFMLFGATALLSTKIMMILGTILSGVFMYLLCKELFGKMGGFVGGLFYLYAPFHAVDIYVRGDVAEFWAYAFIPLTFLGVYKKNILIGSIGFAGVILSHNLTALMIAPFLLFVVLISLLKSLREKRFFIISNLSLIILLGLSLSAFYWVPALLEMGSTNVLSQIGGGADFRDHFVCISQLWNSQWGFGGSIPGCIDGMSFKVGKIHVFSAFASIILLMVVIKKRIFETQEFIILISLLGFILSVFLTLDFSKFLWEIVPMMEFFQFPWRFLILISFFSSLLAGSLIYLSKKLKIYKTYYFLILLFILLFFNIKLFYPQAITYRGSEEYTTERELKWVVSKISDEFLPPDFKKPKSEYEIAKAPLDFQGTTVQKVSNAVSLIGILALFAGIIYNYGKKRS